MLRVMLRLLIPSLSLVVSLTALTHNAAACSGGGGGNVPILLILSTVDNVISGRIDWVDQTGYNATVSVSRYLNGKGGPDTIIVSMISKTSIVHWQEREGTYTCGSASPRPQPFVAGEDVVMFLNRSADGTYQLGWHIFFDNAYARFPTLESTVEVGYSWTDSRDDFGLYKRQHLNRRQLIKLILSVPEMARIRPYQSPPPLYAPLLLTTASGRHYRVPVNGVPIEDVSLDGIFRPNLSCWTMGCTAWSPEGLDKQTIGGTSALTSNGYLNGYPSTSEAIAFSPLGDAYAIWEDTADGVMLEIQVLPVVTAIKVDSDLPFPEPITMQLAFNAPLATLSNLGAWSPDGRIFAFVDSNGLWFWDVFTPDMPPELSPYRDVTAVHGYSWTGRYLSVTDDDSKHYIDLVTGEDFPDGAWGPDDRALLVYGAPPTLIYTVPYREERVLVLPQDSELRYAEWTRRWAFVALTCNDQGACGIYDGAIQSQYSFGYYNNPLPYIGHAFDYSADTGSLAVVKDGHTLTIRHGPAGEHYEIDVSGVDGDVISVEWLPSVFYDSNYDGTAW